MIYDRRRLIAGATALGFAGSAARRPDASARQQVREPVFSLPIGWPGRPPGDGFFIRHGYACENTWYNPGWWHTGEDWYAFDGDSAGAELYAVADGEIVFAGSEYPGLVVIVRHGNGLFSMYGHLDYQLDVSAGEVVSRGQRLGVVLARADGRAPSHLHFEVRDFLTTAEVNGDAPRYGYGCGFQCPPGPGYWPIDATEHPSDLGWRNPTHVVARRSFGGEQPSSGAEVVVNGAAVGTTLSIWSAPEGDDGAAEIGSLSLEAEVRMPLLAIRAGGEATRRSSAEGYRFWLQLALPDGELGWLRAALPSSVETGSDGRPSAINLPFVFAVGR